MKTAIKLSLLIVAYPVFALMGVVDLVVLEPGRIEAWKRGRSFGNWEAKR